MMPLTKIVVCVLIAAAAVMASMLVRGRRDSPGTLDWVVGGLAAIVADVAL